MMLYKEVRCKDVGNRWKILNFEKHSRKLVNLNEARNEITGLEKKYMQMIR